jgi:hypothetical protein
MQSIKKSCIKGLPIGQPFYVYLDFRIHMAFYLGEPLPDKQMMSWLRPYNPILGL